MSSMTRKLHSSASNMFLRGQVEGVELCRSWGLDCRLHNQLFLREGGVIISKERQVCCIYHLCASVDSGKGSQFQLGKQDSGAHRSSKSTKVWNCFGLITLAVCLPCTNEYYSRWRVMVLLSNAVADVISSILTELWPVLVPSNNFLVMVVDTFFAGYFKNWLLIKQDHSRRGDIPLMQVKVL